MNKKSADEAIINFTRNVWRICFPNHKIAPVSLSYDPLSSRVNTLSGLCHIAHDYFHYDWKQDPDGQIYSIDTYDRDNYPTSCDITIDDLSNLQPLECVLFVSSDNAENIQIVLKKLTSNGIAIVINECVTLTNDWVPLDIQTDAMFGETKSFDGDESLPSEQLKTIMAYMKP